MAEFRRLSLILGAAAMAVAVPPCATACDSTCCLLLTRGTAGLMGRRAFQIELSYRHTDMSARLAGSAQTDQVIRPKVLLETGQVIPGYHEDLTGSDSFLQLDAAFGVAASTTLFASLPVAGRREYQIGHGGVQGSYSVHGMGDLVVGARQAFLRTPQRSVVASLGIKLPTGSNDVIDYYDSTLLDPTLQPGTGSGDVITALQWSSVGPRRTEVSLSGSYQINTTNDYRYQFANQAIAAATMGRPVGRFTPSLQLKLLRQGRSRLDGADVPSTGATIVYLNTGLRFRSAEGVGIYSFFLVPVYRRVNDAQLGPRFSVVAGLSKTF
jgi:hypothetical protein